MTQTASVLPKSVIILSKSSPYLGGRLSCGVAATRTPLVQLLSSANQSINQAAQATRTLIWVNEAGGKLEIQAQPLPGPLPAIGGDVVHLMRVDRVGVFRFVVSRHGAEGSNWPKLCLKIE